jgi:competence protein ComEA
MPTLVNTAKTLVFVALFAMQSVFALPPGAVNVNTATAEQLAETLTGVGESKARAIVDYRETHGDFVDLDELMAVRGIGDHVIETNREKIYFSED